jgi:hypothetical protein
MLVWGLVGLVTGGAVAALLGGLSDPGALTLTHPAMIGFMVFVYGWMLVWAWRQQRRLGIPLGRFFRGQPPPLPPIAGVILLVLLFSFGTFWFTYELLSRLAPSLAEQLLEGPDLLVLPITSLRDVFLNVAVFLVVVVLAPVVEELLFRGFLLNRWGRRWGLRAGIIVSSMVFAVLHAHWVGLFVFGVVMSLLYVATGSLWAPVLAHVLNNGLAFVLAFLGQADLRMMDPGTVESVGTSGWTAGLMLLVSAPLLGRWLHERWPAADVPLPWDAPLARVPRADALPELPDGHAPKDDQTPEQDRA